MASSFSRRALKFEKVESRLCLALTVGVASNGDLEVTGDTTGPVEIVALDADSYQVSENSVPLTIVDGVTRAIRISLGGSNDVVTLDLANQTVGGSVLVNLGDGDNSLTVKDGTIRGHLVVEGGAGADVIDVQRDIAVFKNATFNLGAGDNIATLSANFSGPRDLRGRCRQRSTDNGQ